jgi:hypothetical protein
MFVPHHIMEIEENHLAKPPGDMPIRISMAPNLPIENQMGVLQFTQLSELKSIHEDPLLFKLHQSIIFTTKMEAPPQVHIMGEDKKCEEVAEQQIILLRDEGLIIIHKQILYHLMAMRTEGMKGVQSELQMK